MPNYRYNTSDCTKRGQSGCSRQTSPAAASVRPMSSKSTCCDDRAEYDELNGLPIAMAYVPWQQWRAIYEVEKGFHRGTIFEELDKPFKGIGGCCK